MLTAKVNINTTQNQVQMRYNDKSSYQDFCVQNGGVCKSYNINLCSGWPQVTNRMQSKICALVQNLTAHRHNVVNTA